MGESVKLTDGRYFDASSIWDFTQQKTQESINEQLSSGRLKYLGAIYLATNENITKTVTQSSSDLNSSIPFERGKKYIIICDLTQYSTLTKGNIIYGLKVYWESEEGTSSYNVINCGNIQNPFSDDRSATRSGGVEYYRPGSEKGYTFMGSLLFAELTSSESASTVDIKVSADFLIFEIIE